MARVQDTEGVGEVAARIRQRRPGGTLRPIDRVLLHSPRVADGWNALLGTLRGGTDLRGDLRELVVLRIAVLNDADYEWASHQDDATTAGLQPAQLDALRTDDAPASPVFDPLQQSVLRLTDAMTRDVTVPDRLFDELVSALGVQQMVELVVTVGAYNMVSRLVVALQVETPAEAETR